MAVAAEGEAAAAAAAAAENESTRKGAFLGKVLDARSCWTATMETTDDVKGS